VTYDSPSEVKLVINKSPKGLVPYGYQTISVPNQNSGNIQIRRTEGGLISKVVPKTS